jgi:hypothetical protein
MSIIVLFEQMKSGDFIKIKVGKFLTDSRIFPEYNPYVVHNMKNILVIIGIFYSGS